MTPITARATTSAGDFFCELSTFTYASTFLRSDPGWNRSCCLDVWALGEARATVERRHHTRKPVHLPISFSGSEMSGEGIVCDLSSQGCAVESKTSVPEGTVLKLEILMPDHYSPTGVERAVVHWTGSRRFGVRFERMSSQARVRLGRIIKSRLGEAK